MTRITIEGQDDLIAAKQAEVGHRASFVVSLLQQLEGVAPLEPDRYRDYDEWYLAALEDGLLRRVLLIEYREWARDVEDLLRDQLSRQGLDSSLWDEIKEGEGLGSFAARLRRLLLEVFEAELPAEVWEGLEELGAVAETINHATRHARAALHEHYPDYFSTIDAFGDGDEKGRLTITPDHARRAFDVVSRFWRELPYRRAAEGAA